MEQGARDIARTAGRYYARSPRGLAFLADVAPGVAREAHTRAAFEERGTHVPPFLICSVSSACNLRCAGCYARANGTVGAETAARELTDAQWARALDEADEIGASFVLLAGGEPLMRRGVIELAARHRDMVFPVFTNGTLLDGDYLDLFDRSRSLVPVLSLEGDPARTDARRGSGVSARVGRAIEALGERGILWGTSITVTSESMAEVTDGAYVRSLRGCGCGAVIFTKYVPVRRGTERMALDPAAHRDLMRCVDSLRADPANACMVMIAFPGNGERMGGCLAAGRGFFHVSQAGDAEPCPFSPFSVANVAQVGLLGALRSPFFARVREVEARHAGEAMSGCTLFSHRSEVLQARLSQTSSAGRAPGHRSLSRVI